MPRTAHRSRCAPAIEALEARTFLSVMAARQPARAAQVVSAPAADTSHALLVRVADGTPQATVQRFYRSLGVAEVRSFPGGPSVLRLPSQAARDQAVASLNARPWVEYAEPDAPLVRSTDQLRAVPNDASFPLLWGLDNATDRDINGPEAWATAGGGDGVLVAVLDTGIDLSHPDLAGRIWVNPREIPGNGIDDDGNGFADDANGWNFVSDSPDVQDDNGHGSHVSGTIAANFNNDVGVTGVAWGAKILPLKVLDAQGGGKTSDAVEAIYYAARQGARVINASWGGPGYSRFLNDAIRDVGQADPAAGKLGSVFVTAAGNEATDNDTRPNYPANNRHGTTITVAAIDQSGALASFSNYGPGTVDVAAPGERIVSTVPTGYASYTGTSMATPHVSGVVALAAARYPGETAAQLAQRVIATARPLPELAGRLVSGGVVDAAAAVAAPPTPAQQVPAPTSTTPPAPTPTPTPPALAPTPAPTPETPPEAPPGSTAIDPLPISPRPLPGAATDDLVRATLLSSDEFYARAGGTHEAYVEALYRLVLERPSEPAGMANWIGHLRSGAARIDVASAIIRSNEARRVMVAHWFRSDLGRPGTIADLKNDPGVAWQAAAMDQGIRPDAVRSAILGSAEFVARQGGTAEGMVVGAYRALLGRDPNSATRLAAAAQITAGAWNASTLAMSIQMIDEAARAKVASWYRSDLGRSTPLDQLKVDPGVAYWASLLPRA